MRRHDRSTGGVAEGDDARLAAWAPALIAVIGCVGSAFLFAGMRRVESDMGRSALQRESVSFVGAVGRELEVSLEQLHSVAALYDASQIVEDDEFSTFTEDLLERRPAVRAIASLTENTDTSVGARRYVVEHVAGVETASLRRFVDSGDDRELKQCVARAQAAEPTSPALSQPLIDAQGAPRVLAVIPIDPLRIALILLDVQVVTDAQSVERAGWALGLADVDGGKQLTSAVQADADSFTRALSIGDRMWRVTSVPPPGALAEAHTVRPWIIATLGLVATGLLMLATATATSRARIRKLVQRRTQEVQDAYDTLANEAEERRIAVAESRRLERQLRETIDLVPNLIYVRDWNGRFLLANRATAEAYGTTVDELTGPTGLAITDLEGEAPSDLVEERRLMKAGLSSVVPAAPFVDARGKRRILRTVKIPCDVFGDERSALLCVATDITEQKHAEESLSGQNRVLRELASGARVVDVLGGLVGATEEIVADMRCSVLLLDGTRLQHGAGPSLPDFYNKAIDGLEIGPRIGSCGAAAHSGERVIVENIFEHPNWEGYRRLAKRANISACWSQPIRGSDGRILGTFAMYYSEPRAPEDFEVRLLEAAAHLAGLALERGDPPRHEHPESVRA